MAEPSAPEYRESPAAVQGLNRSGAHLLDTFPVAPLRRTTAKIQREIQNLGWIISVGTMVQGSDTVMLGAPAFNATATGLAPMIGGLTVPAKFMIPFSACHHAPF